MKNKSLTDFTNKEDPILKEEFHTLTSKKLEKSLPLWRKVGSFIMKNWNNMKNTWKGIKFPVSLKIVAFRVPVVLGHWWYFLSVIKILQPISMILPKPVIITWIYSWNYKKRLNIHINIFQTILQQGVVQSS